MYVERHIPDTIEQALQFLNRSSPRAVPLGHGVYLEEAGGMDVAVVDLGKLALDNIQARGVNLEVGAMVTLDQLANAPMTPRQVRAAIRLEARETRRREASLAGTLVVADGQSAVATLLLAMDARLTLQPGDEDLFVGNFLPLRGERLEGRLITKISFPLHVSIAFKSVIQGGEPRPAVCVGVVRWPSGRTRAALGGFGPAPVLAFDSPEDSGIAYAVEDAFSRAGDPHMSAEERQREAVRLTTECLATLSSAPKTFATGK